ncbi:hypothetical protein ABT340_35670 [Streptosporangium sp. NPDC000239]|uniref:hypothetical protein n=1 Tax=Streptosporangium sp. NPDC000239 TaxID=3154248 RepID=UPI0033239D2D
MKDVMRWNTPGTAEVRWERDGIGSVYGHYDCTGCGREGEYGTYGNAQSHALDCHVLPD